MEDGVDGSPSTMRDCRRLYPDTTGTCPTPAESFSDDGAGSLYSGGACTCWIL